MTVGQPLPLGTRIPLSHHAVSVSIPTMHDVVGYEEQRPDVMQKMASGYPRFVIHAFHQQIIAHWQRLFERSEPIWLTSSEAMAKRLQSYLGSAETKYLRHRGVSGLRLPPDPQLFRQAKLFLQHTGGTLSTRQAEDYLVAEGLLEHGTDEARFPGDASAKLKQALAPRLGVPEENVALANCGMNAFFSVFRAINAAQAPRGRQSWIKLGWLYMDTMHILEKLSPDGAVNRDFIDVTDLDALEACLAKEGHRFAGIITEAPTNPLIQTVDFDRLQALARQHGIYLVIDPSVNSPANIDVSPYADITVCSLTKYAASQGDVIMGSVAVSENCPDGPALLAAIRAELEPPYPADLARLAAQIDDWDPTLQAINQNTAAVVAFLQDHPKVRAVYWAKQPSSKSNYEKIARHENAVGGLISFEVEGSLTRFYDALALPKGPSFGMATTLVCPFIYLAHYDLVTSDSGRETLAKANICPDLVRMAVGTEALPEITAELEKALQLA